MPHILIVEDDKAVNDLISMTMDVAGYQYSCVYDGNQALQIICEKDFDVVLLDVMLPGIDGFGVFERMGKEVPVIFITARSSVSDRVHGLRMGAQDYMVKPFEPMELLARVENVLRRNTAKIEVMRAHDVALDTGKRVVTRGGEGIELTPQEYELLVLFMRNPNIALTREQMLDAAWGYDFFGSSRTVDMHVQKLRKKLGWEEKIQTVYKLGYRLEA